MHWDGERERVYLPLQPSSKNVLEGAFFRFLSLSLSSCPAEIFCSGQGRCFGGDSGEFWSEREFVLLIYSDKVSDEFACHVGLSLSDDMTCGQLKKVAKCARQPKNIFSSHCWVESCVTRDGKTGRSVRPALARSALGQVGPHPYTGQGGSWFVVRPALPRINMPFNI